MKLIEVRDTDHNKEFLELPLLIYKNDPNYIRPLDSDVKSVFEKTSNQYFEDGKCIRWILQDGNGKTIGRIAAFINSLTAFKGDFPTGGIGFFECIDREEAAFMLFDTAREWLKEMGMAAVDGPVNLGSRERWWGLLVDGFHPPSYCANYNPPYYRNFFEAYGFQIYFKQYTYLKRVHEELKPVHYAIAKRVVRNGEYSFRHLEVKKLGKYIEDFRTVYNKAWINHEGTTELSSLHAKKLVSDLEPVIDERIAWFAYYKEEPVGFFLSLPELNQLFVKYTNGKVGFADKLRLLFNKWTGSTKLMYGLAFGIVPEHQRKGVEIAMIAAAADAIRGKVPYQELQMNWIGDFNPKMMNLAEQIGGRIYKTHHTYRYIFDRTKEFERHPVI